MARFVYFYLMRAAPDATRQLAPLHVDYWKSRHVDGYAGGPFADRTGGLIMFEAASLDAATALADADPFFTHNLIETSWVKEWLPE